MKIIRKIYPFIIVGILIFLFYVNGIIDLFQVIPMLFMFILGHYRLTDWSKDNGIAIDSLPEDENVATERVLNSLFPYTNDATWNEIQDMKRDRYMNKIKEISEKKKSEENI